MLERLRDSVGRPLLTVAGGYLLFSLAWILLSDWALLAIAPSRADLSTWQTYKGLAFVGLSTTLVAVLLTREAIRRQSLDLYWRDVIDLADEGFWLIGADRRTETVNRRLAASLGYEPAEMIGHTPFHFVVEEDRPVLERQLGRHPGEGSDGAGPGPRQYELRLRHRDGRAVAFLVHATSLRNAGGEVAGSYAFMTDLTGIRKRERMLHLDRYAIDHCFDEIYRIDRHGRIVDANRAACHNLGFSRAELIKRTIGDVDPSYTPARWQAHWRGLQQRGALTLETYHRTRAGVDYPVEVAVSHLVYQGEAFAYAVARDLGARKAAEGSALRANEALRALSRANAAVSQATDKADLLRHVCEALTRSRGYPLAWVALAGADDGQTVEIAAASGAAQSYLEGQVSYGDRPGGQGPVSRAIGTGEIQLLRDVDTVAGDEPWRSAAGQYGFRASASLPIRVDGRVIGALNVYATEPAAFDAQELPLLEELAGELGFGMRTLEVRAERDRQLAQLRLAGTVFDNSAEAIMVTNAARRIETVNGAFSRITGYPPDEVIGRAPEMLQSGPQNDPVYAQLWSKVEEEGWWQGEIWGRRRNGELFPEWLTLTAVRDDAGAVTHYVGMFADLTQAHRTRKELAFRTYHDTLTGLPNRVLFRDRLQQLLDGPAPHLAVVLIDLQGFRALNDSFGADGGDDVLRHTGARLRAVLPKRDLIARPGGDEFWIALHDEPHHPRVDEWIRRLMAAISEPLTIAGQNVRLEANMGVALTPEDGTGLDELLTNAATALHRAQEQGRGHIDYFQPDMHAAVQQRVRVEEALKEAIERDELRVWFQPQVNIATGAIYGAEALVRWEHPEWGLLAPVEFVPNAEATGLVARLGDWVLEQALERLAHWRAAGYPVARVSVNAAATQLQWPDWPERVHAMLERTGVPAHCLEIEITEEGVFGNLHSALTTMEWLKALDIRLAIDDFGKGYSSLSYLKQFPIDTLKIDKGFVDGLPDTDYDRSIAEAILAVSRALGFEVVAEGVETRAQAEWLQARGVQQAQGFLFHRPQPGDTFEQLLARIRPAPDIPAVPGRAGGTRRVSGGDQTRPGRTKRRTPRA